MAGRRRSSLFYQGKRVLKKPHPMRDFFSNLFWFFLSWIFEFGVIASAIYYVGSAIIAFFPQLIF